MASPDWTTLSTIASTVAIVMGGFLWFASKIFRLGQTSQQLTDTAQRLDSIETDVRDLRNEVRSAHSELNQRIDQLIFTIAESNKH